VSLYFVIKVATFLDEIRPFSGVVSIFASLTDYRHVILFVQSFTAYFYKAFAPSGGQFARLDHEILIITDEHLHDDGRNDDKQTTKPRTTSVNKCRVLTNYFVVVINCTRLGRLCL